MRSSHDSSASASTRSGAATRRVTSARYEAIPHTVLQDARLSFRARGVLVYLLSLPERWRTSVGRIAQASPREGRDAIATALNELERHGYLHRSRIRCDDGTFDWLWVYAADPVDLADYLDTADDDTGCGSTVDGLPGPGPTSTEATKPQVTPETGYPLTGNPSSKKEHIERSPNPAHSAGNTAPTRCVHNLRSCRACRTNPRARADQRQQQTDAERRQARVAAQLAAREARAHVPGRTATSQELRAVIREQMTSKTPGRTRVAPTGRMPGRRRHPSRQLDNHPNGAQATVGSGHADPLDTC